MDGLAERPALADEHNISDFDVEGGRDVGRQVPVPLLVPVVLGHVVQIVASDDDGARHLGRDDYSFQYLAPDRHVAAEGAFLIDVAPLNGLLRGSEVQPHVLVVPHS